MCRRALARAKYSSSSTDDDSGRSHAARSFWREENRRWRQRFMLVCSTSSFLEAAAVLQLLERQQRCGSRELKAAARGSRLRDWILPRRRSRRRRRPAPGLDLALARCWSAVWKLKAAASTQEKQRTSSARQASSRLRGWILPPGGAAADMLWGWTRHR